MTMYLIEGRLNHETRGQYVLSKESAYAIFEEMKQDFPKVNIYEKNNGEYKRIEKWKRPMTRDEWFCTLSTEEKAKFLVGAIKDCGWCLDGGQPRKWSFCGDSMESCPAESVENMEKWLKEKHDDGNT